MRGPPAHSSLPQPPQGCLTRSGAGVNEPSRKEPGHWTWHLVGCIAALLLSVGACIPDSSPVEPAVPGPRALPEGLPEEVRALWVVRTSLEHPDSLEAVVERADAGGFNTLLVEVRGRGDAWYRSEREPPPIQWDEVPKGYDPLGILVKEAGARDIQVHAWIGVHLVASADLLPSDSLHIVRRHPDWLAVPRDLAPKLHDMDPHDPAYLDALAEWTLENLDRVEGLYTSPAHPQVQAHVTGVVEDLLSRYPIHGIHLDYIRYPAPDFDFSRASLVTFAQWLDSDAPGRAGLERIGGADALEPESLPDALPEHWDEFRRNQVTNQALKIAETVRAGWPQALVSAAVFPDLDDAHHTRFQPWGQWLEWGVVDVATPMAYTNDPGTFTQHLNGALGLGKSSRIWIGVGLFENSFSEAVSQAHLARSNGFGGVALFSYDWAIGPEGSAAAGTGPGGYLLRWGQEGWIH